MSNDELALSLVLLMLYCITIIVGGAIVLGIAWFITHRIPSTKDEIAKGNLFRITGSVERDEKGTFVRLSWMRATAPNLKLKYQITRNPRFPLSAEIGKGQIEWLTVQDCEYKDYDVMFGQTYEYQVIEPAFQQDGIGSYVTLKDTRSMPFRIKVQ